MLKTASELKKITEKHISVSKYLEEIDNNINRISSKEIQRVHQMIELSALTEYSCVLKYPEIDVTTEANLINEKVKENIIKHFKDWGYQVTVNEKDYTITWIAAK